MLKTAIILFGTLFFVVAGAFAIAEYVGEAPMYVDFYFNTLCVLGASLVLFTILAFLALIVGKD